MSAQLETLCKHWAPGIPCWWPSSMQFNLVSPAPPIIVCDFLYDMVIGLLKRSTLGKPRAGCLPWSRTTHLRVGPVSPIQELPTILNVLLPEKDHLGPLRTPAFCSGEREKWMLYSLSMAPSGCPTASWRAQRKGGPPALV